MPTAASSVGEDLARADAPPNDGRLTWQDFGSIGERCAAVRRERDLPNTVAPLDPLDAQHLSSPEHVREALGRRPEHQRAIRPLLNELVRARQARL